MYYLALVVCVAECFVSGKTNAEDRWPVQLTVEQGELEGFYDPSTNVTVFLGVPYGKPPLGELRFRPPERLASWRGARTAIVFSDACLQNMTTTWWYATNPIHANTSEDCLYLNIYLPGNFSSEPKSALPVMIWIHGGWFQIGSGMAQDGTRLSLTGNVIVVTLNYRLGIFGFLATGDKDLQGNYGILDQQLAIQWIKHNIHHFGGDSNKITLFGESSGAMSVEFHVLSPRSKGLFQRAALASWNGLLHLKKRNETQPAEAMINVARLVGCVKGDTELPKISDVAHCLRHQAASHLFEASQKTGFFSFMPVVDYAYLPDDPSKLRIGGSFSNVDCLIGADSSAFFPLLSTYPLPRNEQLLRRVIKRFGSHLHTPFNKISKDAILAKYFPANAKGFVAAFLNIVRDKQVSSAVAAANSYSLSGSQTYLYYIAHRWPQSPPLASSTASVLQELPFLFGQTFLGAHSTNDTATTEELYISQKMMAALSTFAYHGRPRSHSNVTWPQYDGSKKWYLELTANITEDKVKTKLLEGARIFWNELIPTLLTWKNNTLVKPHIMPTMQRRGNSVDWGMTEKQVEELLLALLIVTLFLAVICATLITIISKIHKVRVHMRMNKKSSEECGRTGLSSHGIVNEYMNQNKEPTIEENTKL